MSKTLLIGKGEHEIHLLTGMANRHGLIAGATGTGKTVTLQVLAEGFSREGVPVFMADVKGDLSGISQAGRPNPKISQRLTDIGIEGFAFEAIPVAFWDLFGEQGHPLRATISELGPLLLSRLLGLNDTQEGILALAFRIADDNGLLLLDMKDLRAITQFLGENARELRSAYGNISTASIGAIQRRLLSLEDQGGDRFFGEPALNPMDLMGTDQRGYGVVNILAADRLMRSPQLYATLLMWLLAELFEQLPEVGDADKPRLVFFFDEAHLLFDEAPKALLEKIEQVVRLIRSKGVGVYFITQNPRDIPDDVLGQLGNRFQHGLRAFTPRDQKAVRAAAQTFRANPALDTEAVIQTLGIGEALVSTLDENGYPTMVERTLIRPPRGQIGPISEQQRRELVRGSPVFGRYEDPIDRESAYEMLKARAEQAALEEALRAEQARWNAEASRGQGKPAARARQRETPVETFLKSAARAVGSQFGRQLGRGILGSLLGGKR
jgi:hypothetical protein